MSSLNSGPRAYPTPSPTSAPGALPAEGLLAVGDSWALGWSAPLLFALFHRPPSERDFELFLAAQAKDIDEWPSWSRRCVIYHATASASLSAGQRQAAADMATARRDKLAQICTGYVFCTRSGLTRGVVKVIDWLAPPPYPSSQASTVTEGLTQLRRLDPRIEPKSHLARYRSLFSQFLPKDQGHEL